MQMPGKGRDMSEKQPRKKSRLVYIWLLVPSATVLWVHLYNRIEPALFGIPFYYWYQMLWIVLGALVILPVYLYEEWRRK